MFGEKARLGMKGTQEERSGGRIGALSVSVVGKGEGEAEGEAEGEGEAPFLPLVDRMGGFIIETNKIN